MTTALGERLAAEFGGERVYAGKYSPLQRAFFPTIKVETVAAPLQVFRATSTAEVSRVMQLAYEVEEPVYARQGTGQLSLDTVSPFPPGGVVLDLRDLNHFSLVRSRGYVELGPAITLAESNRLLDGTGYRFPIAVEPVTWGALASVNLSGHLVDAVSGKPGELVLGLEAVLPQGQIIQTGTRSPRKVVGPDLTRLLVGGQGLFGVMTSLRLRLTAAPKAYARAWAAFPDLPTLGAAVAAMYSTPLTPPSLMELLGEDFASESGLASELHRGPLLLVSTDGPDQGSADRKLKELTALWVDEYSASIGLMDEGTWGEAWTIREAPQHTFAGEYLIGEVLDVPIDRLPEALEAITAVQARARETWPGLTTYLIGHIGSGTLHPAFSVPPDWDYGHRIRVTEWIRDAVRTVRLSVEATIGEQGLFPEHARWYGEHFGDASVAAIRAMKLALDPLDLLNRGRLPRLQES